jgi:hypothetical protein
MGVALDADRLGCLAALQGGASDPPEGPAP